MSICVFDLLSLSGEYNEELDRVEKGYLEELKCVKEDHLREMEELREESCGREPDSQELQQRHEIELRQIEEAYR